MRSMTGFGAAVADSAFGRVGVEMRSLNHRFSEVLVRIPRELAPLEDRVRSLVQARIYRGRVEVSVWRENHRGRLRAVRADLDLARDYLTAARQLARKLRLRGAVALAQVVAFPEVIRLEETTADTDALWPELERVVQTALEDLLRMRTEEGLRLTVDARERLDRIEVLLDQIQARAGRTVAEYAARLRQRLDELLGTIPVDEARLVAEVALFAERSDITEEVTRLRGHLTQFRAEVNAEGAVGRRLEFILQEMGREANTIGAKANDLEISRAVIAAKSELESLREQVQNVE